MPKQGVSDNVIIHSPGQALIAHKNSWVTWSPHVHIGRSTEGDHGISHQAFTAIDVRGVRSAPTYRRRGISTVRITSHGTSGCIATALGTTQKVPLIAKGLSSLGTAEQGRKAGGEVDAQTDYARRE